MRIIAATVAIVLAAASMGWAHDDESTTFTMAWTHYAAIERALAGDTIEGVPAHARALRDAARAAVADFDADHAGVSANQSASCKQMLPRLADAAMKLAGAKSLADARTAFVPLSDEMIAFRGMVPGDGPRVAYCPMSKHSWLQEGDTITNPFFGKKMPRCGKFIDNQPGRGDMMMKGHSGNGAKGDDASAGGMMKMQGHSSHGAMKSGDDAAGGMMMENMKMSCKTMMAQGKMMENMDMPCKTMMAQAESAGGMPCCKQEH